ncbi:MAG: Asp-tRNA(Asn)/Glu-tRNA(Gln) amidotransferase subunit GatC [Candidatus Nanoarchaeia archaeon]|nr:Asp-tRNA(Asn)/Glu-tRNA(Gln) amidotransferase subunit GatC [Candidatus Nanoarchaeia archaeon]
MIITKETLQKVAKNARLNLTEKELEEFLPQIKDVINAFSEISRIETKDIEPSIQPIPLEGVMRDDKPSKSLTEDEIFANTRLKKDGYFKGPRVL